MGSQRLYLAYRDVCTSERYFVLVPTPISFSNGLLKSHSTATPPECKLRSLWGEDGLIVARASQLELAPEIHSQLKARLGIFNIYEGCVL